METTLTNGRRDLGLDTYQAFIDYIDRGEATTRTYINNLRQFAAWLDMRGIRQPTRQDIIFYRAYLESEHEAIRLGPAGWEYRLDRSGHRYTVRHKAATVAQYIRSVRQFFAWTEAAGLYPDIAKNVHAPKLQNDQHKKDALQAGDVKAIIDSLQERVRASRTRREEEQARRTLALFLLAVTAGLRTVELSRANVKDLETRGGRTWLYIWGKGRAEPDQKKALAQDVAKELRLYLKSRIDHVRDNSPLFVATGNRSGGRRLASTTISTMLKRALQAAGYDSERLTAHSLRHTAGTNVQHITGDLYATQRFMRHRNPATTEIYLHNDTAGQDADIAERLYLAYTAN